MMHHLADLLRRPPLVQQLPGNVKFDEVLKAVEAHGVALGQPALDTRPENAS
jgi:hypothetical protein